MSDLGLSRAGLALASLVVSSLVGCHSVDARVWNLKQLHADTGQHKYSGALEGEFEFFLRHVVTAPLTATGAKLADKAPVRIDDPAGECLDELIALESLDSHNERTAAVQIEWESRMAGEDPWVLSRERALAALGAHGARLGAVVPAAPAAEPAPAGPEAVSSALAALVKSARPWIDGARTKSATAKADLAAACELLAELPLDLSGARRALRVTTDVWVQAGTRRPDAQPIADLVHALERSAIARALAHGLDDEAPRARAAALTAGVESGGTAVLASYLPRLHDEQDPQVLARLCLTVREHGVPGAAHGDEAARHTRELWLAGLMHLAIERPESVVRVAAMQALADASESGLASLREEDWRRWWDARRSAAHGGAGSSGTPGGARSAGASAP